MKAELKLCPFCGGDNPYISVNFILCPVCECRGPIVAEHPNYNKLQDKWNTRAEAPQEQKDES